jgi:hypothetical protein
MPDRILYLPTLFDGVADASGYEVCMPIEYWINVYHLFSDWMALVSRGQKKADIKHIAGRYGWQCPSKYALLGQDILYNFPCRKNYLENHIAKTLLKLDKAQASKNYDTGSLGLSIEFHYPIAHVLFGMLQVAEAGARRFAFLLNLEKQNNYWLDNVDDIHTQTWDTGDWEGIASVNAAVAKAHLRPFFEKEHMYEAYEAWHYRINFSAAQERLLAMRPTDAGLL